ncbi:hypothetical protein FUAX_01970 [Fulvitalea axinellae]|uniref:SMI1/KNR4 family protein n=1 Tax=Fulvitalea axinellae TaxID=1182444 RepID=A0AAU9DA66_9BACT|nr:hypothetical protein FUAX_01970 [Fulvitalea axinellae]
MGKLPVEILPYFKQAGWFEGRSVDIQAELKDEFGTYPDSYIKFMSEFSDLSVHHRGTHEIERASGEKDEYSFDRYIWFDLMYDRDLMYYEDGEEGGIKYYSELMNQQLYPVGEMDEGFTVAIDEKLRIYIFNTGILGCLRVHDDAYIGLKYILMNDLYSTSYVLEEEGEHAGKWFKRE